MENTKNDQVETLGTQKVNPKANKIRRDLQRSERQEKVLARFRAGQPIAQIAKALGCDQSTVFRDVQAVYKKAAQFAIKDASILIHRDLDTLGEMQAGLYKEAISGNGFAVDKLLKILERRAKLMGLDAPAKVEVMLKDEVKKLFDILETKLPPEVFAQVNQVLLNPNTAPNQANDENEEDE